MSCASPERELVTFWVAGSLTPAEVAAVSHHVAGCDECRAAARESAVLVEGLQALHLSTEEIASAAAFETDSPHVLVCSRCREEIAVLRTVNADLAARSSVAVSGSVPGRSWRVALAITAAVVIAVPVIWRSFYSSTSPPAAESTSPPSAPVASIPRIKVEKASLASLASESVTLRGAATPRQALLQDLAIALEPYRTDNFVEAAARLQAVQIRHPESSEVPYYLGVCLLMLDRPAEALPPLNGALSREPLIKDALYYLAVAKVNASRNRAEFRAARLELKRVCDQTRDATAKACLALRSVDERPR